MVTTHEDPFSPPDWLEAWLEEEEPRGEQPLPRDEALEVLETILADLVPV